MFVAIYDAVIAGQPVHDAIAKIHDANIGGEPVQGEFATI